MTATIRRDEQRGTLVIEAPDGFAWVYAEQMVVLFRRVDAVSHSALRRGAIIFPGAAVETFEAACFEEQLMRNRERDIDR